MCVLCETAMEAAQGARLGVEVAAALAAAHGQRGQRVLEDLLEAQELDDAQRHARVEAQPACHARAEQPARPV